MHKKFQLFLGFLVSFVSFSVYSQSSRAVTSSEILLQLKKLNTFGSVLYIAAHPDDENTRLIAYLANEKYLRTGYLSLTRGDGGQNLIGSEQGVELGVIRTQELLAARRVDGGEQFFTRAYDFGYSKTVEETLHKWNKDSILSDVVWVIRNFKPDIIITRFATDGSGGHGHHTASALLAEEAFEAAGDSSRFTEQLKFTSVWKPKRLFWNVSTRFQNPNADMSAYIKLDVGGYNPLLGKSYGEIAAESRSMHKSQGFGSAKQRGENFEYFKPIKGDTANLNSIFDRIDFTWNRVKNGKKLADQLNKIIQQFNVSHPEKSGKALLHYYQNLQILNQQYDGALSYSLGLANQIIKNIYGIHIEYTADTFQVSANDSIQTTLNFISRLYSNATLNTFTDAGLFAGNSALNNKLIQKQAATNIPITIVNKAKLSEHILVSQPIHLMHGIKNNIFEIPDVQLRSLPETSPQHTATIQLQIENTKLNWNVNTNYKWTDPEKGELKRPVIVTPPVLINPLNKLIVCTNNSANELRVVLKACKDNLKGTLLIEVPNGWQIQLKQKVTDKNYVQTNVLKQEFMFTKSGEEKEVVFFVSATDAAKDTVITLQATVSGVSYNYSMKEIKYDHIVPQTIFYPANVNLINLKVNKKSKRIGYIPGAGDEVPLALTQLGYDVVILNNEKLNGEDISAYDAILTGVRAFNTNPSLMVHKDKLMRYVQQGGNLIVQYNTNSWAGPLSGNIGPYNFKITRNRITNEEAKVNFVLPNHPVLNTPNRITAKDFEGWVQERSIYQAGEWDDKYETPISMADPNEKEDKGALLIAKHGKGYFAYTGIVFFRELPAGVSGAYRLLVNLIELGK